jgi:hypothetical protein
VSVKKKLMRGYAQAFRDLPTFLLICRHLTRSVDISRPAPSNSLALFNDNPRKLCIDRRQLALYNKGMKKRKRFDIQKYNRQCYINQEQWLEHFKVIRTHPLTWLILVMAIVYGFNL